MDLQPGPLPVPGVGQEEGTLDLALHDVAVLDGGERGHQAGTDFEPWQVGQIGVKGGMPTSPVALHLLQGWVAHVAMCPTPHPNMG
jgi:hypothetical protein